MITLSTNLNLVQRGVLPRINVSQYDKGQTVSCTIYNGVTEYSIPSGTTATVQGTKKDGTGFEYNASISGSVVTFTVTDQMTVFAGDVATEIVLQKNNARVATVNFILSVEASALEDDVPVSETDLPLLQQIPEALEMAEDFAELAHKWASFGNTSELPSALNNAKYWAEQSQLYAVGALHWKGTCTFATIPTSNLTVGDVWNVSDAFTTDSRFVDGAGIECLPGTNIIWAEGGKWDIQNPPGVNAFNGRKGAVVPASGDYNASQITHGNTNVGAEIEEAQEDITQIKSSLSEKTTVYRNLNVSGTSESDAISNIMVDLGNRTNDGDTCIGSGYAGTIGMFHCVYTKESASRRMMILQNYQDIYYADHNVGVAMSIFKANHTQIQ